MRFDIEWPLVHTRHPGPRLISLFFRPRRPGREKWVFSEGEGATVATSCPELLTGAGRGEPPVARLLSRTSITVDEAVSILLGRSTGPIDFGPIDDVGDNPDDVPTFDLREVLEDELEVLTGEHELAKYEKLPAYFIAEKAAAVQHHEELIEQANLYLCQIQDDLNKGEGSVLKVDRSLSNASYTFITLHSFNQWAKALAGPLTESAPSSSELAKTKPRTRMKDQEDAILEEIRRQGFDPMALPPYSSGKRGVKSDIRDSLKDSPLFTAKTAFRNAWEDLADYNLIAYAPDPTPDKKMK